MSSVPVTVQHRETYPTRTIGDISILLEGYGLIGVCTQYKGKDDIRHIWQVVELKRPARPHGT